MEESVSHYRILEEINRGSMGIVYKAKDETLERIVALKTIAPHLSAEQAWRQRFLEEARKAAQVEHPNVGTIHEIIEREDGRLFLAMPYYDGQALRNRIDAGRLSVAEVITIASQIAKGVAAIHERGIIHRDLKPANILFSSDHHIKVVDFGVAIPTNQTLHGESAFLFGTGPYMSPEQVQGTTLHEQSDIWSFGVILYEMVVGTSPFASNDLKETFKLILLGKYAPVESLRRNVPLALVSLITRCLRLDPKERPQTMKGVAEELSRMQHNDPGQVHVDGWRARMKEILRELKARRVLRMLFAYPPAAGGTLGVVKYITDMFDLSPKILNVLSICAYVGFPAALLFAWFVGNKGQLIGIWEEEQRREGHDKAADEETIKADLFGWQSLKRPAGKVLAALVLVSVVVATIISIRIAFPPVPQVVSLAVLPFESPTTVPAWLSDGLTQAVNDCLAQLPQLKVVSQNSARRFRDPDLSLREIGKQLGSDAVMTGKLEQMGKALRLRLSLYHVENGKEIWNFDITSDEPATFGPEVAKEFAYFRRISLNDTTARRITVFYTPSHEAFEQYLRGMDESQPRTKEANRLAIFYLRKAVEYDSVYVPASNFLAHLLHERYEKGWETNDELLEEAAQYCNRSLRREPLNASARALLGVIEGQRENHKEAIRLSREALKADPNNLVALTNLGSIFLNREPEEAITYFKRVQEIEPLSWFVYVNLGVGYAKMNNLPEAYRMWQVALKLDSNQVETWITLGDYYTYHAKYDSAELCLRRALRDRPLEAGLYEHLGTILLAQRKYAAAEELMRSAINDIRGDYNLLYVLAIAHLAAGHTPEAKLALQQGLRLAQEQQKARPENSSLRAVQGLFEARLERKIEAGRLAARASTDSLNPETMVRVAGIYALLSQREKMLDAYARAYASNPELDVQYLRTAIDFEHYRQDPELLAVASGIPRQ